MELRRKRVTWEVDEAPPTQGGTATCCTRGEAGDLPDIRPLFGDALACALWDAVSAVADQLHSRRGRLQRRKAWCRGTADLWSSTYPRSALTSSHPSSVHD